MNSKIIKILGITLILSMFVLSVVPTITNGELPPPYGQAAPISGQLPINV